MYYAINSRPSLDSIFTISSLCPLMFSWRQLCVSQFQPQASPGQTSGFCYKMSPAAGHLVVNSVPAPPGICKQEMFAS